MGLKEPFMTQWEDVADGETLDLEADTGESILIKGVDAWCNITPDLFCEFTIGRLTVGYFHNSFSYANHLEQFCLGMIKGNILAQMIEHGIMVGYPIAEGETFKIDNTQGGAAYRAVYYELYDAGDMLPEMPNGSKSKEYSFVNYGTNGTALVANSYGEADESRNPGEYPAFPFGEEVPSKTEIDIHAFLILNYDPTGAPATTRDEVRSLRLTKDREVMFDKTRIGQYCTQGMTQLSWGCGRQVPVQKVEWLPKPITFYPGEELKVEMSCGGTLIAQRELEIAIIETVRRVD